MAAMTLFDHFVADIAVRHQAALRAAKALPPSVLTGRTKAEQEISKITIAMIEQLHRLPALVGQLGAQGVFQPPDAPFEQAELVKLGVRAP